VVEVLFTDEFEDWWQDLTEASQDDVAVAVGVLADRGVALGYPRSSAIRGSSIGLRELRVRSMGRALRVFYVFDPGRNAVLLIGGDKTGRSRFYREMIPLAERVFEQYLAATGQDEEG
jgi:hypothetical protein